MMINHVFYTRFLSPADQKCAGSSTYWQFFYYHPPSKFRYTAREFAKMWCQYLAIYMYKEIYGYHLLDISIENTKNLSYITLSWVIYCENEVDPCQFDLRLQHFSKFLFNVFLWLIGEVVRVRMYWFKAAEGFSAFQRRPPTLAQITLNCVS